jgi:hypothetical protein
MGRKPHPFRLNVAARYPEIAPTSTFAPTDALPPVAGRGYERAMSARVRKFIGLFGILIFLIGYAVAASKIADHLPNNIALEAAFYLVVGLAWGVPILPLIRWMNSGR